MLPSDPALLLDAYVGALQRQAAAAADEATHEGTDEHDALRVLFASLANLLFLRAKPISIIADLDLRKTETILARLAFNGIIGQDRVRAEWLNEDKSEEIQGIGFMMDVLCGAGLVYRRWSRRDDSPTYFHRDHYRGPRFPEIGRPRAHHERTVKFRGEVLASIRREYRSDEAATVRSIAARHGVSMATAMFALSGLGAYRDIACPEPPIPDDDRLRRGRGRKLDEAVAERIRSDHAAGESTGSVARRMGLDHKTVWQIIEGKTYRPFTTNSPDDWRTRVVP